MGEKQTGFSPIVTSLQVDDKGFNRNADSHFAKGYLINSFPFPCER